MLVKHLRDYRDVRRVEYPPLADFADAMYWSSQGDPTRLAAYFAKCEEVKVKYPKPDPA